MKKEDYGMSEIRYNYDTEEILSGLAELNRWRKYFLITLFIILPVFIFIAFMVGKYVIYFILVAVALFIIVGGKNITSRCPRCNNFFYYNGLFAVPFTRRCIKCGLKLDEIIETNR